MKKNKINKVGLFSYYSWLENIGCKFLEWMPPFIRNNILRITMGAYEKGAYIDYQVYMRYPKHIYVGKNSTINRGCAIFASFYEKDVKIKIGENVAIGPYCTFYSAGHDHRGIDLPNTAATIEVEDNVWIGGRSIILQGVTIGEGSIVGAGSIVTKDIPKWSIAVGNPAKVIKIREIDTSNLTKE